MVRHYAIDAGRLVESAQAGPVMAYIAPTEAEVTELKHLHNIDAHNIQSALDPDEIGRLEMEDDHLALILKRPRNYSSKDNFLFRVMSTGAFLFKDKLVIIVENDVALFEGKQASKVANLHDVLLRLINTTQAHFMGHLKVINMLSESIEQKVSASIENKHLLNMFTLEKSLVYFLSALHDNSLALSKLKSYATRAGFTPENVELLEDIVIDNQQCLTLAQTYSNILSGLMDARASLVSNNLNVMMKNLNAVVIAVAVPSFLAAVGGMSEFSAVSGGPANAWVSYPLFLLTMIGIAVATYFIIKRLERH